MTSGAPGRPRLVIGLLNNMADGALAAAERQFGGLLGEAGADFEIELRLFSLPEIPRGALARAEMSGRYRSADAIPSAGLDGLVVTGAEPGPGDLASEPFWPSLCRVIDWTDAAAVPVVWSCLAAHAAAQRQAGVTRRRLAAKKSGVFACHRAGRHPLARALPEVFASPHSRCNELAEADLLQAGYEILTRSPEAGVDAFVRDRGALALHIQGHPEYEADTLAREYWRDLGRFLRGERPDHPATPSGYLGAEAERRLERLAAKPRQRADPALAEAYAQALAGARPLRTWRAPAVRLYAAWLEHVAGLKRPVSGLARVKTTLLRA